VAEEIGGSSGVSEGGELSVTKTPMLKFRRIVRRSARRIATAATHTVDDLVAGRVEHEPEFTGEMLGRMKQSMQGYRIGGVRWDAKILTSHGTNAQERRFGADFMGVLDLDLPEYKIQKGFLAQAKRIESGKRMSNEDWDRMAVQCKKMLSITPESFIFVYSPQEIVVIPALAIISAQQRSSLTEFYSRSLVRFYEDHFECFVGDMKLDSADIKILEELETRSGLLLRATTDQSESDRPVSLVGV
jgi:hypothetical protein